MVTFVKRGETDVKCGGVWRGPGGQGSAEGLPREGLALPGPGVAQEGFLFHREHWCQADRRKNRGGALRGPGLTWDSDLGDRYQQVHGRLCECPV